MSRNFGKQVQWDGLMVPDIESNIPTIRALTLVSLPHMALKASMIGWSFHECCRFLSQVLSLEVPHIWTLSSWDFTLMTLMKSYREMLKQCHVDEPAAQLAPPLSTSGLRHAILQQEGIVRLQQVGVVALSRRKNYSTACGCLFSVAEERKANRLLPQAFRDIRQVT